jgi:copper chaperone CopZ
MATMAKLTHIVPDMSCSHCERAISSAVEAVAGVQSVAIDLEAKLIAVRGADLDDDAVRAAIADAGYEVE